MELIQLMISILALAGVLYLIFKNSSENGNSVMNVIGNQIHKEFRDSRMELNELIQASRQEQIQTINTLTTRIDEELKNLTKDLNIQAKDNRFELNRSLTEFKVQFEKNVQEFNNLQKEKFQIMETKQKELISSTELKLEKMRETVDEKLHKTLEERLGQSFKMVTERLEAVQKGLGEMQTLANGVGDLKKVLSNVKTRGILGEIQLGNILEQILAPEQYAANIKTKLTSNDVVEFAIKLPGRDGDDQDVYLPIDAKFPQEDYIRLQNAYDEGDQKNIETYRRALVQSVKKFAKDIHNKYIDPPHTTEFGIMFLPVEGLFAELVRFPDLVTVLQRDYKIIITGPTTLAAILNSLQMGFKTLAIQKRSSEVWNVLGQVKSEFKKFGGVLEKAQKKIGEANKELDNLVGTRTRMMLSKLKNVESIPVIEAKDESISEGNLTDNLFQSESDDEIQTV